LLGLATVQRRPAFQAKLRPLTRIRRSTSRGVRVFVSLAVDTNKTGSGNIHSPAIFSQFDQRREQPAGAAG
jgi:hypothetical protein